jgi:hypothetical protein
MEQHADELSDEHDEKEEHEYQSDWFQLEPLPFVACCVYLKI